MGDEREKTPDELRRQAEARQEELDERFIKTQDNQQYEINYLKGTAGLVVFGVITILASALIDTYIEPIIGQPLDCFKVGLWVTAVTSLGFGWKRLGRWYKQNREGHVRADRSYFTWEDEKRNKDE